MRTGTRDAAAPGSGKSATAPSVLSDAPKFITEEQSGPSLAPGPALLDIDIDDLLARPPAEDVAAEGADEQEDPTEAFLSGFRVLNISASASSTHARARQAASEDGGAGDGGASDSEDDPGECRCVSASVRVRVCVPRHGRRRQFLISSGRSVDCMACSLPLPDLFGKLVTEKEIRAAGVEVDLDLPGAMVPLYIGSRKRNVRTFGGAAASFPLRPTLHRD